MSTSGRRWMFGFCEYVEVSRTLIVHGQPVRMEAKPLDVLLRLLEQPNQIVGKDELLDAVWPEITTTEQSLTTAISKLRKAFGGPRDDIIINITGIGYRLAVPVTCVAEGSEDLPHFVLKPGDVIPHRPNWHAVKALTQEELPTVWLAKYQKTGEERVYKFAVDGIRLRALQREVAIARLLSRTLGESAGAYVKVLDWAFEEAPFFVESEYCGFNLLEWSSAGHLQQLAMEERVALAAELAAAIAAAHALGILHNDLKPSNILIAGRPRPTGRTVNDHSDPFAATWQIKVADFGVASISDASRLRELEITDHGSFTESDGRSSTPVGTAMYRAPELHTGDTPSAKGDVYALGVLLYQLVCGDFYEPPAPGWEQKISDPLLRMDIADAANVDPAKRISTAAELANRLHGIRRRREEKAQGDASAGKIQRAEEALARARERRPWVVGTIVSLSFGLLVTLWSTYRAAHERDAAKDRNATLSAMYDFLALDLLGQSNPYLGVAGSGRAPQQTLLDAISTALPQIDGRFSRQPEIAGRLHETIADSLRSRTRFQEADEEYATAAKRFREAGGPLSQDAIVADLKKNFALLSALLPGSVEAARHGFEREKTLIAQLRNPTAELTAWKTLVETGLIGLGPNPEQALPVLTEAVKRAEATPGFDPLLLIRLKNQFCGTYVRLGDGANLERISNEIIALLTAQHGPDSATLSPYQMYLEEAFFLQGKYSETIAQADRNFSRFNAVLGREHQLTLATLATRAAAEGQLERYDDAVRDDLALFAAEQMNPSGKRMEEGSLSDAAMFECHSGHYRSGIEHARQVIQATAPGPSEQPLFFNGSQFTVAECLISEQEATAGHKNDGALHEADALLEKVDTKVIAELSGNTDYEGFRDVALARLSALRGQFAQAQHYVTAAEPVLGQPNTDPYEVKALQSVKRTLATHTLE